MQATPEQLKTLEKLQDADRKALLAQHELDALPQKGEIERTKERVQKAEADAAKADELHESATMELDKLQEEDRQLAERQDASKERIDTTEGDFRGITSLTRDLEGTAKRRETLQFEMGKAHDRIAAIDKVVDQAKDVLDTLKARQQKLEAAFEEESSELRATVEEQKKVAEGLEAELPKDLLKAYHRTARHCGGVAVAHLVDGNHCSVCRSAIEENRLLVIKREAPISTCPSCHRMLLID